jgi:hypothetical protein
MRKSGSFLLALEIFVILLMSVVAGYALLGASAQMLIPFAVLCLLGVLTIVVLPLPGLIFSAASVLTLVPALMKLNGVKWWVFSPERLAFCPDLSLPAALAIGLSVISGGLLLSFLQPLRHELRGLRSGEADGQQSRSCALNQCLAAGSAILASALAGALIVLIIGAIRGDLSGWLKRWPWALPVGATASIAVLALAVFWLARSRRSGAQGH